jgi:hypothetical protein
MSSNMSQAPNPAGSMPQGSSPWNNSVYTARNFFIYESDIIANLAGGASVTQSFNIAGDSDFFWTKFASYALVADTPPDVVPAVSMLLTNTTTGRQYSSSATPLGNMSGNGRLPFILPQITMWQRKSTIQIQLQNIGNATYTNLCLSFLGIKAFPTS